MTRLEKKCFIASVGMHGLLAVILVASSAFREEPPSKDLPVLTMIPANILDGEGAGGGSPTPTVAPQPQPQTQPAPAPVPVAPPRLAEPVKQVKPIEPAEPAHAMEPIVPVHRTEPRVVETSEPVVDHGALPEKRVTRHHEIQPNFTPVTVTHTKTHATQTADTTSETTASSSSRYSARERRDIATALNDLARGVRNSGAQGTVVDMPGQGGGEAFAGYETVIYNVYFHAWATPDGIADKLANTDAKIVVARDGTILSAEIVNKSGEPAMDRSVDRVLRVVTHLPPFPASAHDEQRTFLLRFNLEAKEGSG